jgi:hypothetical protein
MAIYPPALGFKFDVCINGQHIGSGTNCTILEEKELNVFCEDCAYLKPTEKEQNEQHHKDSHMCTLYNFRVFHVTDHAIDRSSLESIKLKHGNKIHKCSKCLIKNRKIKSKMYFISKMAFEN